MTDDASGRFLCTGNVREHNCPVADRALVPPTLTMQDGTAVFHLDGFVVCLTRRWGRRSEHRHIGQNTRNDGGNYPQLTAEPGPTDSGSRTPIRYHYPEALMWVQLQATGHIDHATWSRELVVRGPTHCLFDLRGVRVSETRDLSQRCDARVPKVERRLVSGLLETVPVSLIDLGKLRDIR